MHPISRGLLVAAFLAIASGVAGAQRPVPPRQPDQPGPPPRSELRSREVSVVIDGCVENRRLRPTAGSATLNPHEEVLHATEYILEGPRELLGQLARDHRGHHEEIVGVAILPPTPAGETVDTRTREIGGVRISGAMRQSGGSTAGDARGMVDAPRPVRIRVKATTHLADHCTARH